MKGQVRVGRRIYSGSSFVDPKIKDFIPILVLTKSSPYGELGPYVLKDDNGVIIENRWQGSKVYDYVPPSVQKYSRYDNTIIWSHPAEKHLDEKGNLLPEWFAWQEKLFKNEYAVRYPVGMKHRHNCVGVYDPKFCKTENKKNFLDLVDSRINIYATEYCKSARKIKTFRTLQKRIESGENLLIIEVDGPHQESLEYYKEKYAVDDSFIENSTILVEKDNMRIMINDPLHSYGHGYCLAVALLNMEKECHVRF